MTTFAYVNTWDSINNSTCQLYEAIPRGFDSPLSLGDFVHKQVCPKLGLDPMDWVVLKCERPALDIYVAIAVNVRTSDAITYSLRYES